MAIFSHYVLFFTSSHLSLSQLVSHTQEQNHHTIFLNGTTLEVMRLF